LSIPVWIYWEGACPEWIRKCQETIFANHDDVRLLGPIELDQLRRIDRDIDLTGLCVAHRSDFLRAFLVANFGGFWIDSDCIVMKPLWPLLKELGSYELTAYCERQGNVSNSFFGAPAGSRLASEYYQRVCQLMRSGQPLQWLSLGAEALGDTLREAGRPWLRIETELVQPVCWSDPGAFFAIRDALGHEQVWNRQSLCYMLSNHMVQSFQAEDPTRELLRDGTFFRFLLDRALEHCGPAINASSLDWTYARSGVKVP
jgi:hypothetical protein